MNLQDVLLEQPEPGIHLLTVNRPKALNALNAATLDELAQAIAQVSGDEHARVLLVTGASERAFVAGADIAEMQGKSVAEARAFSEQGHRVMHAVESLPVPALALVNGYCLGGGGELALARDWILASESAAFGQPEVNLGMPPDSAARSGLPRCIGSARALELPVSGRQVKSDEALRIGLANKSIPPRNFVPGVWNWRARSRPKDCRCASRRAHAPCRNTRCFLWFRRVFRTAAWKLRGRADYNSSPKPPDGVPTCG